MVEPVLRCQRRCLRRFAGKERRRFEGWRWPVRHPAPPRRSVGLVDGGLWSSLSSDVKGDAYEGLLEKNAADSKGGAGQYFTPRALIAAMGDVMAPPPGQT